MAFPFPIYGDPDYYAASVALEILGGGMTSRLFREVREKRGLVYSVSAMFAPNGEFGAGYLYAGTTPEKASETVKVMLDELRLLQDEGVSEDELARAKTQLKSELVMRGESSAARMGALARSWWFERKLTTIQELKAAVDGVTTEQILGLMRRYPPTTPLVIGAIGPRTAEEADQRRAGGFAAINSRRTVGGAYMPCPSRLSRRQRVPRPFKAGREARRKASHER